MVMRWYGKILIPSDGGAHTLPAIQRGLEVAKLLNAEVTALSVIDVRAFASLSQGYSLPDMYSYLDAVAESAVELVRLEGRKLQVDVEMVVKRGSPAVDIIEESKKHDLVVMGTSGRKGLPHLMMGSVAEKVVRFAECPVMVVKGPITTANG